MKPKYIVSITFLATLVASLIFVKLGSASAPTISVSPVTTGVQVGEKFTIDINLDYAENLYAYEVWLSFDNSKLNATAINYTNYLNDPHRIWYTEVNNAGGYVTLAVSSLYSALPKTGGSPPPLAYINFTAINAGSSPLHLYNTILADNQSLPIPHTTIDGTVQVTAAGVHDVEVTAVTPLTTIVGQNYSMKINVTIANQGEFTEIFDVTVYANTTATKTKEITLTNGSSIMETFTWNTSGFAMGNYIISAYAWPVPDELDQADNNCTDGLVQITIFCDVNGDGSVDMADISLMIDWFMASPPNWDPNCDVNDDLTIDMADISLAIEHFMESIP